jgi:tetratricopeptide (TPR) repeat protein
MTSSISDKNGMRKRSNSPVLVVVSGEKITRVIVDKERDKWEKIPLFYLPLGLTILLITLALSSMSKRQTVSLAMLALLFMGERNLNAGILDFTILNHATKAYEAKEYTTSAKLFREYQYLHDSPQVRYNYANALFKAGDYEKARYWYEHVNATDPKLAKWVEFNKKKLPMEKALILQKSVGNSSNNRVEKESIQVKNSTKGEKTTLLFAY